MPGIVLYQPEIPPNTGNIIRLASNTGFALHLIRPLGFDMAAKSLRRAGLDYHEFSAVTVHENWHNFMDMARPARLWAFSTRGTTAYSEVGYGEEDFLLFGPETRGLPDEILQSSAVSGVLRLPMQATSRSLNLSNSVAVAVYEAWRQLGFSGAKREGHGGSHDQGGK